MTSRLISFVMLFNILSRDIMCSNVHYFGKSVTTNYFVRAIQYISKYNLQLDDSNVKSSYLIHKLFCKVKITNFILSICQPVFNF